jgi:DNA/RNA endonuclease YhcR with UshA esterase domain
LLREGRWQSRILRSPTPEEVTALLRRLTAIGSVVAAPQPSPEQVAIKETSSGGSQVLDAADKNLAQHVQDAVSVVGHVARVSWTTAHNAVNIEFEGPESAGLLIWVSPSAVPKLKEALGEDFEQKLAGAKVQIRGRVLKYGGTKSEWKNRLQITFDNKDNIKILSDDANNAPPPPSTTVATPEQPKPSADVSPKPETAALDAASEQLPDHVDENVVVTGRVKLVSWTAAHTGINIEFDGPKNANLMIWVSPKSLPKLKEALGDDFEQKLKDARLQVRGKLQKYAGVDPNWKNRLQISFDNKDQIKILSND